MPAANPDALERTTSSDRATRIGRWRETSSLTEGTGRTRPSDTVPVTPEPNEVELLPSTREEPWDADTPWIPAGGTPTTTMSSSAPEADMPPFWSQEVHGTFGKVGNNKGNNTKADRVRDSKLPKGHWTRQVKSAASLSSVKRNSVAATTASLRQSLRSSGGNMQERHRWLEALPPYERLQSLRLSMDRDASSPDFTPWTSTVDERFSSKEWAADSERTIRRALVTLERMMLDHVDRLVAYECYHSQSPSATPADLLWRAFQRWDASRAGTVDLQGFLYVWNMDLKLAELVDPMSVHHHVGCTLDHVFGRLLRRRMVSMNAAASLFHKYGCDKNGLLRYDLFINGLCSAPARLLGMERILSTRDSGANGLTVGATRGKGDDPNFDGRVLYPKCKNAVFPPMDFAPENVLRSDCPPKASMQLEHVYGYAGTNNLAPNIYFLQSGEVVYYTAALGVVFSKEHWRAKQPSQRFFFGHDNDIQCLNVHPNRRFVVSGQQVEIGGVPFCCVWDALPEATSASAAAAPAGCPQLQRLEHPKSVRSVIAATFSTSDASPGDERGRLLITLGADNRHSCFVWDWCKGQPLRRAADPRLAAASNIPAWYYGPQKKWKHLFYPCMHHAINPAASKGFQTKRVSEVCSAQASPTAAPRVPKKKGATARADAATADVAGAAEETLSGDGTFALHSTFATMQGAPPQVFGVVWNPYKPFLHKMGNGVVVAGGEFVTYGLNHVKAWTAVSNTWVGTSGQFGSDKVDAVLSAEFIPGHGAAAAACSLVTGFRDGRLGVWVSDGESAQCQYKLVAKVDAHGLGSKVITADGKMTYEGVRALKLRDQSTLLSGGADGAVISWDVRNIGNHNVKAQGNLVRYGDAKQTAGPHRFVLKVDGVTSKAACVRGLDCLPSMPECFIAGTAQCDVWEVDKDPEILVHGHGGDLHCLATHPTLPHVFASACEARRVYVWDAAARGLARTSQTQLSATAIAFSQTPVDAVAVHMWNPSGGAAHHLAVGGMCGSIQVMDADTLQPLLLLERSTSAITDIKYTPQTAHRPTDCGHLMAAASRDLCIYVYDVTKGYQLKARCMGHTATVAHIDWTLPLMEPKELRGRTVLKSNCNAYELLYWDPVTGRQCTQNLRDAQLHTQTAVIGFDVMGIWPDGSDGTDINALDRSHCIDTSGTEHTAAPRQRDGIRGAGFVVTADDYGTVKLFNWPVVADDAPFRAYKGHASHVACVRFASDDGRVLTAGGKDRTLLQFKTHGVATAAFGQVEPARWCDVDACESCGRHKPKPPKPPPKWKWGVKGVSASGVQYFGPIDEE